MGERGPLPMDDTTQEARNTRRRARSKSRGLDPAAVRTWKARAEKLERLATRMLDGAVKKPTTKTPSNGVQMSAKLNAALKLFDAADKIWQRLARLQPGAGATPQEPDGLDAARQAKPRTH